MQMQCPHCQSTQVSPRATDLDRYKNRDRLFHSISPTSLVLLGIKISARAQIPPYVGGLVGLLAGGTLMLLTQYMLSQQQRSQCYDCHACQRSYSVSL